MGTVDLSVYRKDFPMLDGKMMNGHPLVYFDNAATTLKPRKVIDTVLKYYEEETTNVERGDSALSALVSAKYENVRKIIAKFIGCDPEEVVYTSGATGALNLLAEGYGMKFLAEGDVILTTEEEHASNLLPWFRVCERTGAKMRYIPLTEEGRITEENVRSSMDEHVKIVTLAGVSNVLGYEAPLKGIADIAHEYGAVFAVDGAQAVPHFELNMKEMGIDFLSFSSHKMCGPTGAGVLYGRKELLEKMDPANLGGGSNARFDRYGKIILREVPDKFEAGTQPIEGILGMGAAAEYLMEIGIDKIHAYEKELRDYLVKRMEELPNVKVYNPDAETGIVTFNVEGVFPQDAGSYLSSRGIALRSGQHCAKILPDFLKVPGTVRASLYFYNTEEECDRLIEALKTCTVENAVDIFI